MSSDGATSPLRAPLIPLVDDGAAGALHVLPFEVPGLGNRTYIAVVDGSAVLVDPPRDVDVLLDFVRNNGWQLTHILDTHIHNDYVSGGTLAAALTGAHYVAPAGSGVTCAALLMADGDEVSVGTGRVRAVHTPGHTPHHMSYYLSTAGQDSAVFTGGGLLYAGVGRTDLFGPEMAEELARAQWASARRLGIEIDSRASVMPTHGFGSFCSVGESIVAERTLAGLARTNPVFLEDQDDFVRDLLTHQGPYPDYFQYMGPINRGGTPAGSPSLPPITTLVELRERAGAGEWVLDLRHRHAFADGHVRGTLSFDAAGSYVSYIGWLIPWGSDLHLIVPDLTTLGTAVTELARIGVDTVRSAALWRDGSLTEADVVTIRHADGRRLRAALSADSHLAVLDVRLESESARGRLAGQRTIPIHELESNLDAVRNWAAGREVWVYCGSGFRSAVAASLLERAGIAAVHVDGSVIES